MHLLMLLCTSLYFSDPSSSNVFFLGLAFYCTDQQYLHWPRVSSSDDVCQGSHRLFQSLLCWRWWSSKPCLHFHYSWGERCKVLTCHSWEGFQHIRIFELFEVKPESCNLLTLSRRRWKVISSKLSAPEKPGVLAMFAPVRKRFLTKM